MRRLKVGDNLVEVLVLFRKCVDLLGKIVVSVIDFFQGLAKVVVHVLTKVGQGVLHSGLHGLHVGLHGGLHGGLHHAHEFFMQILLSLFVEGRLLGRGGTGGIVFGCGFGGSGDVVACVLFGAGGCVWWVAVILVE